MLDNLNLDPFEVRVLGVLIEKELSTPDYYPLTLNATTTGCNQLSSRDPVMSLSEETVQTTLDRLREKKLVQARNQAGGRSIKYNHCLGGIFSLHEPRLAVLAVLLLRGFQTAGEIRGRTGRMHNFNDVAEVEQVLQELSDKNPALVVKLPRAPGTKESRWAHLLSGELSIERQESAGAMGASGTLLELPSNDRISQLEEELKQARQELAWLTNEFLTFKQQLGS